MFATSGKARLAYSSDGTGDPALLIHAGVTDRRSWRQLTPRLGDFRVVSYDQRGYGETSCTPESYSPATDAVAVLDAAGVERAMVVGCSMGGGVAIDLALEYPERVSRLVLIAPSVTGAPWEEEYPGQIGTVVEKLEAAEESGDVEETNRLEAWVWLDGPGAPEGRVGGETRELFLDMNGIALRRDEPGERDRVEDAWERLGEIAVPTLVMAGELDFPQFGVIGAGMAERMPDARFLPLAGVAHLPHLENDDTCLTAIEEFLSRGL